MEAHKIRPQQPRKEALPPGQDAEHLRRGEWDVEEEADAQAGAPLPQQFRQKHQLVVVYPHRVAVLRFPQHRFRETLVHGAVGLPVPVRVEPDLVEQVVEERPEHTVGKALVVPFHLRAGQLHGHHAAVGQLQEGRVLAGLAEPRRIAGPAHPEGSSPGMGPCQGGGQAAG